MKAVAISEFKAHCLALLEEVAHTGETLLVTKRGKPLARVTPSGETGLASPQDTLRGTVEILGDVLEPALPLSAWSALSLDGEPKKRAPRSGGKRTRR